MHAKIRHFLAPIGHNLQRHTVWCFLLQEARRGLGASAVFIARNRFAVLDKASGTIQVIMWLGGGLCSDFLSAQQGIGALFIHSKAQLQHV